jgi:putative transposase
VPSPGDRRVDLAWVAQYGGMKASDAKRLKELEAENARLKKLVAN